MIKALSNGITPEQAHRASLEVAARQDFEAAIKIQGHAALTEITKRLYSLAFDGANDELPNFNELQVYEMQHALVLLRVCFAAVGEIERSAHDGLKPLRGFAQDELDKLNALKLEFIDLGAI